MTAKRFVTFLLWIFVLAILFFSLIIVFLTALDPYSGWLRIPAIIVVSPYAFVFFLSIQFISEEFFDGS